MGDISGGTIQNSGNSGTIYCEASNINVGGLAGRFGNVTIENCYNTGDILENGLFVGGLVGFTLTSNANIKNSYNSAKNIEGKYIGAILYGINESSSVTLENVYYVSGVEKYIGYLKGTLSGEATECDDDYMQSQEFLDLLNSNALNNDEWNEWVKGESGYPIFE